MRATDEAGPAAGGPLLWHTAEVVDFIDETPRVRTLILDAPGWPGHLAGQHLDVRLTAEDGYKAQRSYSIASAPEDPQLKLTIQLLNEGEVSPYLASITRKGDRFEIRGPIGGHFVWTTRLGGPLFLIAGGSGIAPLMAMLRHRRAAGSTVPALLVYSSRSVEDIIYREELAALAADGSGLRVVHTLTDRVPEGWTGFHRRIDRPMLAETGFAPATLPHAYICGPTGLVESASAALVDLGHDPALIKTERFGPTGT